MTESPKFSIHYKKTKPIDLESLEKNYLPDQEDTEHNYNPYRIKNLQKYNPVYSQFFELNENNFNSISLNHKYALKTQDLVFDPETKEDISKPTFIKYSPLLDPLRYMTGKYKTDIENINGLPYVVTHTDPVNGAQKTHNKLLDYNNSAYTDNFFCYLANQCLATHGFVHGLEYYGSYLGVQEKHKMNVTDDLDYLTGSSFFDKNLNSLFSISVSQDNEFTNFGSRNNKIKLRISNSNDHNITAISVEDLDKNNDVGNNPTVNDHELVYEKLEEENDDSSSDSSNDSHSISDGNNNSHSDNHGDSETDSDSEDNTDNDNEDNNEENSDWETEESSGEYEDDEINKYAYINNFPVQLICLEKCDGTLDELFEKGKIGEKEASAALFQVIMTLLAYQKMFHFTHNDLHTNNIMFIKTEIENLYYKYKNVVYKVPTYGKIYKIIDFGRAIYKFNGKLFCSDSFGPGGDASTQYNCEPFMNDKKPRIDPNYSFDLCRLGCSLYDFVIDDDENPDDFNELQKTVHRWCTDDEGRNVLYKRNGDERYPGFKLYKMIARTVHNHTPEMQFEFKYFNKFTTTKNQEIENLVDLDTLPIYVL
jgi:hypothetical protein